MKNIWPTNVMQIVEKSLADGVVQLAILGVYMRRINYDSAPVNISVYVEQRNISFQNDISLKTMILGVLSSENLKQNATASV